MENSTTQTKQEGTRYQGENLFKTISERGRIESGEKFQQKVGNMGACARIISHTGASNGDAVTASHMTTRRTPQKT